MKKFFQTLGGYWMIKNRYKIQYLNSYKKELYEIIWYISYNFKNEKAAERLLNKISDAIIKRSRSPEIYETYKSKNNRKYIWYRIYVDNYTIFYTVKNDMMKIAHVIYSRRNIDELV